MTTWADVERRISDFRAAVGFLSELAMEANAALWFGNLDTGKAMTLLEQARADWSAADTALCSAINTLRAKAAERKGDAR